MAPQRGEYGPVPWSVPRPKTLWLAATLVVVIQVIQIIGAWRQNSFGWVSIVLTLVLTYLMLRGSKVMWLVGVVWGSLGAWGSIQASFANRALSGYSVPTPNEQLTMGILGALFVLLLLLPSTMHFFDLDRRKQLVDSTS
ncbi:MAG: hypothetical protein M3290_12025 [Actinomycetota bacterium]|nr:hypothetical protein [Actinomycetota bacterium]